MFAFSTSRRRGKLLATGAAFACAAGLFTAVPTASADSIFQHELNRAATSAAEQKYGADPAHSVWWSGGETLNGLTAAGAASVHLPADRELPGVIANKWNALAVFVRDMTGKDPRRPGDLRALNTAFADFTTVLDHQHGDDWAAARNWVDSLGYRELQRVNGHDELRRKVLFSCARCAREIVLTTLGGVGGGAAAIAVNGTSPALVASTAAGAATGFVIGAILGILANRELYRAEQAAELNRNVQRTLARIGTLALSGVYQLEQRTGLDRAELGRVAAEQERQIQRSSTFRGRVSQLFLGS